MGLERIAGKLGTYLFGATKGLGKQIGKVSKNGLIAFEKGNSNIGINIYREIKRIINEYHIHRIEWRMVGNNPVKKHYDKFCKKYNGNKYILKDALRDKQGIYHDDVIYEIVFNN